MELHLENLVKDFSGTKAVDTGSFSIMDGKLTGLLGPSGCGKSTLLYLISGLQKPSQGKIFFGDKDVTDLPPEKRGIGLVFQNYALYPHMTVYKNMAFGLQLRKVPKDEIDRKVHEAAKVLDIEHLLDRKPKALSGGQRQRVALGRAMVRDPAVFLLDEPLSNLDAKLRTQMRTEITKLHKRLGTTFVYVTHDQTEAMTMGDRIVVMKDGIIQQVDTPQNLYNDPCNMFVAGFIGSPQMNFIDAVISQHGDQYHIDFSGYSIPIPQGKGGADTFGAYVGKPVVLGLRAEDFHTEDIFLSNAPESLIDVDIEIAELMGAEVFLYTLCQGNKIVVKAPSRVQARGGDRMQLALDMNKIHVFDKETERAICN